MIPRVNERTHSAHDPLSEALGRAVIAEEGLTEHTIVAYWPALDSYTLDDEQASAVQWADHLEDPLFENPFAASPRGDRQAIAHLDVRLHPDDRDLSGAEWAEIAHRFARAAGIEIPGDVNSCRWIAVQAKPGRLDMIANLIRLDGTWQHPPVDLGGRLNDEARRIEQDLRLIPVATSDSPGSTRPADRVGPARRSAHAVGRRAVGTAGHRAGADRAQRPPPRVPGGRRGLGYRAPPGADRHPPSPRPGGPRRHGRPARRATPSAYGARPGAARSPGLRPPRTVGETLRCLRPTAS